MTGEEKCRVIAGWLGWTEFHLSGTLWYGKPPEDWPQLACVLADLHTSSRSNCWEEWHNPPNFYESEEASAICLEAMPFPSVVMWEGNGPQFVIQGRWWQCIVDHTAFGSAAINVIHADRKTAIAEATFKLAQKAGGKNNG